MKAKLFAAARGIAEPWIILAHSKFKRARKLHWAGGGSSFQGTP